MHHPRRQRGTKAELKGKFCNRAGKIQFTFGQAVQKAAELIAEGSSPTVYQCPFSQHHHYHIGTHRKMHLPRGA